MKRVLLMILDGWGVGKHDHSDAIGSTPTPNITELASNNPRALLYTSGENVGLPDGQMGNSEVGHLNIGAGRVVYQDLVKINRACRDHSIAQNPEIVKAFNYAKENGKQVHFMGLVSNGGVHSSLDHVFALCDLSKEFGIEKTFVHCFMDGRDTDPKSGKGFIGELQNHMKQSSGKIASVIGRYYAMDRDSRWERIKEAYDLLVNGVGTPVTDAEAGVQASYDAGVTDEFIKPIVCVDEAGKPVGTIQPGDMVIFFNFRPDRAREITRTFCCDDFDGFERAARPANLCYVCMTQYDASMPAVTIAFPPQSLANTLGEYIADKGLKQLRIAETEKYAHVTFFFNGGVEAPNRNEDRILIPSPKVATYDMQPEMSAYEVTDKVIEQIKADTYDLIILNFANCDMVGHTGVMEAAVKAVEAVDKCVGRIKDAVLENGGQILLTADHGNADQMTDEAGNIVTAHSLNDVPLVHIAKKPCSLKDGGRLSDIAPTLLDLMNMDIPCEMTGRSLAVKGE